MDYSSPISTWVQHGNVCFWRFKATEHHKFAGWHFNADEAGCDSLLALLSAAAEEGDPVRRAVTLASSQSTAQSRVVGLRGDLRVFCPRKLRIVYCPDDKQRCSLDEEADILTMTLGPEYLRKVSDGIFRVRAGDGDFSVRYDRAANKHGDLFFWWWLNG